MLRLFAALPVPDEVAARIGPLQRGVPGARWSPAANLHVTLRFVGDLDPVGAEDLDAALDTVRCDPFEIALAGAGFFGGDQPHALFLKVVPSEPLALLRQRVERACRDSGLAPDPRAWLPHVTVAYLRRGADLTRVTAFDRNHALTRIGPWMADRFHLYSSHLSDGPSHYHIEAEYPLRG